MSSMLSVALLLLGGPVAAQFTASSTTQVTGQIGVRTVVPRARLEAQLGASDSYALRVSSQDSTAMLTLQRDGKLVIGSITSAADVDVRGASDTEGEIGLQLRSGNSSSTVSSSQIVFADVDGLYRHSIRTRAVSGQNAYNSIDFFLWKSTDDPTALGAYHALSLQASVSGSTASFHVVPSSGIPDAELEVSNGVTMGGGTIHRASTMNPSSREIKKDIAYFGPLEEKRAYEDVRSLRHVLFRYKTDSSLRLVRGLIFEDAPESIRGGGKVLVLNDRVTNLELALRRVRRKIEKLKSQISALERGPE